MLVEDFINELKDKVKGCSYKIEDSDISHEYKLSFYNFDKVLCSYLFRNKYICRQFAEKVLS